MGVFLAYFWIFLQIAYNFKTEALFDLNGDGLLEVINLTHADIEGRFTLKINNLQFSEQLSDSVDGFILVDIDKGDRFVEIAVHTPGPSDDDEFLVLRYKGDTIEPLGKLSRWPYFFGNGIVYVDDWMGFWKKREKYILNQKTEQLEKVPQELYYVGTEATVSKSFPIYRTRENKEIVANLREKSQVVIILCDPSNKDYLKHQYLIKSESDLLGWSSLETLAYSLEGLPWAD